MSTAWIVRAAILGIPPLKFGPGSDESASFRLWLEQDPSLGICSERMVDPYDLLAGYATEDDVLKRDRDRQARGDRGSAAFLAKVPLLSSLSSELCRSDRRTRATASNRKDFPSPWRRWLGGHGIVKVFESPHGCDTTPGTAGEKSKLA